MLVPVSSKILEITVVFHPSIPEKSLLAYTSVRTLVEVKYSNGSTIMAALTREIGSSDGLQSTIAKLKANSEQVVVADTGVAASI